MTMDDLDEIDRVARELCLAQTLAEPYRVAQIESMLVDRPRLKVAQFACYHGQTRTLRLSPEQYPPCWIDPDQIDELLKVPRRDDMHSERAAAALAKRMIDLGLSQYEPDPVKAIERRNGVE